MRNQRTRQMLIALIAEYRLDALVFLLQKRLVVPVTDPTQADRNGILAAVTGFPAIPLIALSTNTSHLVRRASMVNSLCVALATLASVTLGSWASAQTAVPGTSAEPFIYPSKGQTAQQEQKDKYACYDWASQQTGFDPAQELEEQQAAAARARQQSQQAQQTAMQQAESTQGQGVVGAAGGAAGGAIIGAIAGNAGRGAAIGSAVGLLAGWHRRRAEEIAAANQQLQTQQQIAAQSAQQLAVSQQKLANYNLAFKTCMQGRGYTLN